MTLIKETTNNTKELSRFFELLLPTSKVEAVGNDGDFFSIGSGFMSDDFFIGSNLTQNLVELNVDNPSRCIFTYPKQGDYSSKISNRADRSSIDRAGVLIFPCETIKYKAKSDLINDMILIVNVDLVFSILERDMGITEIDGPFLDISEENALKIYTFIESTIRLVSKSEYLQKSPDFKKSIQTTVSFLLADIIAQTKMVNLADVSNYPDLVDKAEEFIMKNSSVIFEISDISNYLSCSPRSIQQAFAVKRPYSPMTFLRDCKLNSARFIIENITQPMLVREVADKVGFLDIKRFGQSYKKKFGVYPSDDILAKFK